MKRPQEIKCYKAEAVIEPQIDTNVESFLLVFLSTALYQGDHRQINLVTLNRFCLLHKTFHPLYLIDNIKLDGISSKVK